LKRGAPSAAYRSTRPQSGRSPNAAFLFSALHCEMSADVAERNCKIIHPAETRCRRALHLRDVKTTYSVARATCGSCVSIYAVALCEHFFLIPRNAISRARPRASLNFIYVLQYILHLQQPFNIAPLTSRKFSDWKENNSPAL